MSKNRYTRIIERLFFSHYTQGAEQVPFPRQDIIRVAKQLRIDLPKNLGDIIYSFRYRGTLPESIRRLAPKGKEWIIRPAGRSLYTFVLSQIANIMPNQLLSETKIPDSTPGIIALYALNDEQALLAKLRYNRLVDIFTGITCYSLQNHLRTAVPGVGQIETDEIYIGVDRRGAHYVFPVQAKGGKDSLSVIQIEQDLAMCSAKFPLLICRPIAAQFMRSDLIALFAFEEDPNGISIASEKHYLLVPPDDLSQADLSAYQKEVF